MLTHEEITALALSLKIAMCSVLVLLVPGIASGFLLARRDFRGKQLVNAFVHLPLVVPPVITGYLLLVMLGSNGVLGSFMAKCGMAFTFNWKGAVLASALVSFPLMVQSVKVAVALVDTRLEEAAQTLGSGPLKVFLTITLPLAMPGILCGTILSFARSLGEFGATITFVGNIEGQTRTLPLAIYSMLQRPDGESGALHLLLISMALSIGAVILAGMLNNRRNAAGAQNVY
jgi:molybdate transport system permease protein